jgi:hypothetical protein
MRIAKVYWTVGKRISAKAKRGKRNSVVVKLQIVAALHGSIRRYSLKDEGNGRRRDKGKKQVPHTSRWTRLGESRGRGKPRPYENVPPFAPFFNAHCGST